MYSQHHFFDDEAFQQAAALWPGGRTGTFLFPILCYCIKLVYDRSAKANAINLCESECRFRYDLIVYRIYYQIVLYVNQNFTVGMKKVKMI
jgi:hypothetical protein